MAVPALADALADEEWHVAANASMALLEIGSDAEASGPGLRKALRHEEWHVRNGAAYALEQIGDPSAIPDLNLLLDDEDAQVSATAREVLAKVQP
jgi:HEAT repeat protein